jgi:hypothetical protein
MDYWVPISLGLFKAVALGVAMYYAIKWHHDQGGTVDRRAMLRTGGILTATFALVLLVVVIIAFALGSMLGLDLSMP